MSEANVAKKKNLKGKKKAAAMAGGALLGAVNPFKVVKTLRTGYKAYKASKYTKAALGAQKSVKAIQKVSVKAKPTIVPKISAKGGTKPLQSVKAFRQIKQQQKSASKIGCFTAGTKVYTEKGFKNIEAIKTGEYVWSENPETKEKALKKVNKIFVREKDSIIRLSINGETIETTHEHPFYVEGIGFVAAKHLKAGTAVRLESGETAYVESFEEIQLSEPIRVYNFEVADFHTYYVSEQKVLVHNTCAVKTKIATSSSRVPNKGFESFTDLKKELGSAGTGNAWHHIVEQSQIERAGIEASKIHNVNNIIALPHGAGTAHAKISGHYNSKPAHLKGLSVRQWLSGKDFEFQFRYGMDQLKQYGEVTETTGGYIFKPYK